MVSHIGNNIRPKGVGLIPPKKVIDGGYRTIIGNGSGLFSQPFTTEWTVAGDAAARTITLPLVQNRAEGALSYNCVVNWGDGTTPSLVTSYNDANRIHTYASDGTYIVKIYGVMEGWSFNDGGDKLKITKVINFGSSPTFDGFKYLAGGFFGCTNLTQAGTGPIPASGTGILSDGFKNTFRTTAVASIPNGLLDNHPLAEEMNYVFYQSAITSIPAGLFDKNTAVTDMSGIFRDCSITSIPEGLFDYNTLNTKFTECFRNSNVTSIPSGLFDYNTAVTTFLRCFNDCVYLTAVPSGLFDNNILVTRIDECFDGCFALETTPSELFRLLVNCTDFSNTFNGCIKHQQNIDLFYRAGEEATRFLNQSPDFTSCFERDSFTGTQGTAPDLWNCSFGTGTPTTTSCWAGAGNSAASLTNYASIPAGWK